MPDHTLVRCIGAGGYGQVWLARNAMGTFRAVKIVYRGRFDNDRPYEREFDGIKSFEPVSRTHNDLIDILQVGRNDDAGLFYYVMELADDQETGQDIDPERYQAKTLESVIRGHGRMPFEECLHLAISLADGLQHLHNAKLIHRDIKPSNIIFVNGIPKIADIGLVTEAGRTVSFVGTEGFIPPEGPGSVQADIYSLGKVIYELSFGKDRQNFPVLPTHFDEFVEQKEFLELNEVILKACDSDVRRRYQSVQELRADLVVLEAGKSVKRLRLLERRLALLSQVGLVVAVLLLLGAAAYYQVYQGRKRPIRAAANSYVAYATREVEKGDLVGSLPWYAEALKLETDDDEREQRHRRHWSAVFRRCPRITQLAFQDGQAYLAQFDREGLRIVSASSDHKARLWRVGRDVTPSLVFVGHSNEVESACFSPDGTLVLTASTDWTARIWDAQTARPVASPLVHPGKVLHAEFSHDGNFIVTACADGRARIWSREGSALRLFPSHGAPLWNASFSPDDRLIVTAGQDSTARIWTVETGEPLGNPLAHGSWVYQARFSPDGRLIATAGFDDVCKIWEVGGDCPIALLPHAAAVRRVEFSPDGRTLVTACWDYTARVWGWNPAAPRWDPFAIKEVIPPLKHNGEIYGVAFSQDGRRIVTASKHGTLCVWDLAPAVWQPPIVSAAVAANGSRVAILTNSVISIFDAGNRGAALAHLPVAGRIRNMVFSGDGNRLVVQTEATNSASVATHTVQVWNVTTAQPFSAPIPLTKAPTGLLLDASGSRMVIVSSLGIETWDGHRDPPGSAPRLIAGARPPAALSHDARLLAVATSTGAFQILDFASGVIRLGPFHVDGMITNLEFSPNGRFLASACMDRTLNPYYAQLWDTQSGLPVGGRLMHGDGVLSVSFNPSGTLLVTASEDRTAQVWEVPAGKFLRRLVHRKQVFNARFSPDGRRIITSVEDGTFRIWDAESGEPLTDPIYSNVLDGATPASAQFLNDDNIVVVHNADGDAQIWVMPQGDLRPVESIVELSELLSGHRTDRSGQEMPLPMDTFKSRWERLVATIPEDLEGSEEHVRVWAEKEAAMSTKWHELQLRSCEQSGQWSPALFHLDRLCALRPNDPGLQLQRDRVRARVRTEPGTR